MSCEAQTRDSRLVAGEETIIGRWWKNENLGCDLCYGIGWAGVMILSYSSATDLQLDQVEAEDLEEELVDGLEDCCSHDENEEEESE